MKAYETRKIEYTTNHLLLVKCDICGKTSSRDNWALDDYEINEVTVKIKQGEIYDGYGDGKEMEIDICPDCFKNKLIPFIESFGTKMEYKNWEY